MNIQEMDAYLRRYEQEKLRLSPEHYTNTVSSVQGWPDIFGVNFGALFSVPPEQAADVFLAQEERASLIRSLMRGETVDGERMKAQFGFTAEELAAYRLAQTPLKKELPERLCVLCFDDALRSQCTVALPLLQKLGFHATFFIAEIQDGPRGSGFQDKSRYMTWEEIKALETAGFELGNHSLHHVFGAQDMGRAFNLSEIRGMEAEFEAHGLKKPVSYAYPSGICNEEALQCARECGYQWARGNLEDSASCLRGMTYYDPCADSPLGICNFGDPDYYSEQLLRRRILETRPGTIFGLTYHDVSEDTWQGSCSFRRQMEVLREMDCRVISISDLSEWVDYDRAFHYIHC